MTFLVTEKLDVAIGGRSLIAALDWQVARGEFWCVLGQNGVGKSSLLYTLAGLLKPADGSILLDGESLALLAPEAAAMKRGLMPQQQLDAFSHTVLDTVLVGRTPYRVGHSWDSEEDRAAAMAALTRVGMADKQERDVTTLSAGERQRTALAALLVQQPQLMLLDEPTAHQDVARQLGMMQLIRDLATEPAPGRAVISSCHDINLAARFASHVLVLAEGRHWLGRTNDVLNCEVLQLAFDCRFEEVATAEGRSFIAHEE
jgi:iron complex transport system ATP-binding protein